MSSKGTTPGTSDPEWQHVISARGSTGYAYSHCPDAAPGRQCAARPLNSATTIHAAIPRQLADAINAARVPAPRTSPQDTQ
jgi:hypothetical protein